MVAMAGDLCADLVGFSRRLVSDRGSVALGIASVRVKSPTF